MTTTSGVQRAEVLLVCQPGGHLLDLVCLRRAWEPWSRIWVTLDAPDSRSLLREERVVFGHGPTVRSLRKLIRNAFLSWRVVRRVRPAVVVTTGAALAVPFACVARAFGARIVYVENGGRVDRPSLACRLIAPFASRIYVQWPELVASVRGARYVGRASLAADDPLLARSTGAPAAPADIFVTVGTCPFPFDRLVATADAFPDHESVFVQTGVSRLRPRRAAAVDFLPFDAMLAHMRTARTVITHAGIGSVTLARASGKRPLVVARRPELGENVDEHQIPFARRLASEGLVTPVEDPALLQQLLAGGADCTAAPANDDTKLADDLAAYVSEVVRNADAASGI